MAINLIVPSSSPTPLPAKRGAVITEPIELTATTAYSNVEITVSIPTKPTGSYVALMATDTAGNTYDIAAVGHWGPSGGFPIPITALPYDAITNVAGVFSKVGDYVIRLTLNADGTITNTDINVSVTEGGASEKILVRRGLKANLPASGTGTPYELLYTTDTNELYVVNSSGTPQKVSDLYLSDTAPSVTNNVLWLDTVDHKFKIWNGSAWVAATTTAISDVTGLQAALDGKAPTIHSHIIGDVTGLQTALDGKAPTVHSHIIGDVTGLQAALDNKSNVGHIHDDRYYTKTYTYSKAEVDAMLATIDGGTF